MDGIPLLFLWSSSRVNKIFNLDLAEKDAKALLKKGHLQSSIGL